MQRVRAAEEARHHHDLMNALTGIEGAATILVTDNVSDEDRTAFLSMLQAEVNRLRSLIEGQDDGIGPISLGAVAADVAGEPRWRGDVHVQVGRDLVAVATSAPVAEALRQLLAFVGDLALDSRLVVLGRREGDRVGLWVKHVGDHQTPTGCQVSVHVADQLMGSQGGEVRVQVGADGSPVIGMWLPALLDEGGDVAEAGN